MAAPVAAAWFSDVQEKMGTLVEVQLWSEDAAEAEALLATAMAEFDRIEQAMSTYIETSEISRVNRDAATRPQTVSAELFQLLEKAQEIAELTDGAFDITYDSVGQLYDYRARRHPDPLEIETRLGTINYRHLLLNPEERTVTFAVPGVRINLGGIAKGYAVGKVIEFLESAGIEHALATAGGDTRILGQRQDAPWVVGIRDPNNANAVFTRVALQDEAISTSGDYERFFIEDGVRYHHILNPSKGTSATGVRSVSVIGPSATVTDGLSTSVFVMGREKGLALIDQLPDYEALIVLSDDEYAVSKGLRPD
ncbi:MAG: FAD:protein FMN transferase [Gammaproteobacteria bacterium]|nr:FAD:protein FMN transferase [Gammaproteobacteria bacterium]NND54021.1 FAD:protein FMN transferase [Gammaproteobacteria bacterium]